MAEAQIIANQKSILKNQKAIIANQQTIKKNQETIKKNQGDIKGNQVTIKKNQDKLDLILKNQVGHHLTCPSTLPVFLGLTRLRKRHRLYHLHNLPLSTADEQPTTLHQILNLLAVKLTTYSLQERKVSQSHRGGVSY